MQKFGINDSSFAHLTLILSLHYLVKCKSRSLAVYNNEWIAHTSAQKITEITKLLEICYLLNTCFIYFKNSTSTN